MNETGTNNDAEFNDISDQQPIEVKQDNAEVHDTEPSTTTFFPVSEDKLFKLYLLSFGLYGIYWFYMNWRLQQPFMNKRIFPLLRAIFSIFFTHSLFNRINQQAMHLAAEHRFSANGYATYYVVTIIASHLTDSFYNNIQITNRLLDNGIIVTSLLLFILSVFPLLKAQATINRINNDIAGYLNHKYSLLNYVLIITGAFIWLMIALGILLDIAGITIPEQPLSS